MSKSACLVLSGFPIVPTSAVALAVGLLLPGGASANECLLENSICFFDKDLRSFYGDSAAPYSFVEGLRYADYYGKGERGSIEPALGTPIWKFLKCGPTQPSAGHGGLETEKVAPLSSAERVTKDGWIAAYGDIKDVGENVACAD